MDNLEFKAKILPLLAQIFPVVARQLNIETASSWARACGNHPISKVESALRAMGDDCDTDFPRPSKLTQKLNGISPDTPGIDNDDLGEKARMKNEYDAGWKRVNDSLKGITDADLASHWLVTCAAFPSTEKFSAQALSHPAVRAAASLRLEAGINPLELFHVVRKTDKNRVVSFEYPIVKPEAFARCQKIRNDAGGVPRHGFDEVAVELGTEKRN